MKSASAICALMVAIASGLLAQSKPTTLLKVYVGPDGLAHVVDVKGRDKVIRKEREQVGVSSPKFAADKQTAGWLIESKNCCTSYAIPTRLAIYNDRKKRLLADGLMVYDWCFVDGGLQVAMSTGTVHGMTARHLTLYDTRTGRLLQASDGEPDAAAPPWARELAQ